MHTRTHTYTYTLTMGRTQKVVFRTQKVVFKTHCDLMDMTVHCSLEFRLGI